MTYSYSGINRLFIFNFYKLFNDRFYCILFLGERCVHLAAEAGHIDILRILVSHGADINARVRLSTCI